jgi:hypothetical protein
VSGETGETPVPPQKPVTQAAAAPVAAAPAAEEDVIKPGGLKPLFAHRRPMPTPAETLRAAEADAALPFWLLPLAWFNQAFDLTIGRLGAPGRWACGAQGRAAIGWVGVVLLGLALALFLLDWIGWTW